MGQSQSDIGEIVGFETLQKLTEPAQMPIDDHVWLELLKVRVPPLQPVDLDNMIRHAMFLKFITTNEVSGNFRNFLRFLTRLLTAFRNSNPDALPCSPTSLASLALIARVLLKQFVEAYTAPELLYHLEHVPQHTHMHTHAQPPPATSTSTSSAAHSTTHKYDPQGGVFTSDEEREMGVGGRRCEVVPDGCIKVTYRGKHAVVISVERPEGQRQEEQTTEHMAEYIKGQVVEWFVNDFPEDADILTNRGFVFREPTAGILTGYDLAIRMGTATVTPAAASSSDTQGPTTSSSSSSEEGPAELGRTVAVIPNGVPRNNSILVNLFLEICEFCVTTQVDFYGHAEVLRVQTILLEVLLTLFAVICPDFEHTAREAMMQDDSQRDKAKACTSDASTSASTCTTVSDGSSDGGGGAGGGVVNTEKEREREKGGGAAEGAAAREEDVGSPLPPISSKAAHSAPLYYIYLQSQQPHPQIMCPMTTAYPLEPYLLFLDAFLEALGAGVQPSKSPLHRSSVAMNHHAAEGGMNDAPGPPQVVRREGPRVLGPSLSAEFLTYLLNTLTLKGPPNESSSNPALIPKALFYRSLSILMLTNFYKAYHHTHSQPNATVQPPTSTQPPQLRGNPCVEAFAAVCDPRYVLEEPQGGEGGEMPPVRCLPLDFPGLLAVVCSDRLQEHLFAVLLYALVYRNRTFRLFLLSQTEPERTLLPILDILYRLPSLCGGSYPALGAKATGRADEVAEEEGKPVHPSCYPAPPAATVLLLVLLILSKDKHLCEAMHKTSVEWQRWFDHNGLKALTLGSLVVVTVLRLAHWNFGHSRDSFLHDIIAAIVTNLAPTLEHLNWYASDRLLDFVSLLARSYTRQVSQALREVRSMAKEHQNQQQQQAAASGGGGGGEEGGAAPVSPQTPSIGSNTSITNAAKPVQRSKSSQISQPDPKAVSVLLRGGLSLLCGALVPPRIARNVHLLYAVVRAYPSSLQSLERKLSDLQDALADVSRLFADPQEDGGRLAKEYGRLSEVLAGADLEAWRDRSALLSQLEYLRELVEYCHRQCLWESQEDNEDEDLSVESNLRQLEEVALKVPSKRPTAPSTPLLNNKTPTIHHSPQSHTPPQTNTTDAPAAPPPNPPQIASLPPAPATAATSAAVALESGLMYPGVIGVSGFSGQEGDKGRESSSASAAGVGGGGDEKESERLVLPPDPSLVEICSPGVEYGYRETHETPSYFLPLIWKTIFYLQPDHLCWEKEALV
ncbi:unnamed protein product [Vitrella brassicaformis CCMP3155]|uniref:Dymeclin n=4 Tax=Vitrella brassicaformis TaxID=1169539 RepID=A0A0G4FBW6_VITBC|nr:unnamed protein product [Vitrella brassicaformis CCMP3155]|eukprot:CEM10734.1 unnamed protein product [Vitrella brassicaformis CCMP3155]